jgi:hypothetical protein
MALADSECATYWLKSEHQAKLHNRFGAAAFFESNFSGFEVRSDQRVILRVTSAARFVKNIAQC